MGLVAYGSIMRGYDFMYFAHFLTEYTYMLINILYLRLKITLILTTTYDWLNILLCL